MDTGLIYFKYTDNKNGYGYIRYYLPIITKVPISLSDLPPPCPLPD